MSLINQMLTDLEARRGGKLHQVDQALNGLRSAAEAPRQRQIPRFLGVGALLLITALGGWLLHEVLNRTVPAAPEPLAVVPPQAPPPAAPEGKAASWKPGQDGGFPRQFLHIASSGPAAWALSS